MKNHILRLHCGETMKAVTYTSILAILVSLSGCISSAVRVDQTPTSAVQMATEQGSSALKQMRTASSKTVLIAAHRGGYERDKAEQAPENSLANIQLSHSKGIALY